MKTLQRPKVDSVLTERLMYRIQKDNPDFTTEEVSRAYTEGLDFLDRCATAASGEILTPTKHEDALWHAFLMHSREYYEYCMGLCGQVIHHAPRWPVKAKKDSDCTYPNCSAKPCQADIQAKAKADCAADPCNCCSPCGKSVRQEVDRIIGIPEEARSA